MKNTHEYVMVPKTVVESLSKRHPQLSVFLPHEKPVISKDQVGEIEKELSLYHQVLVRATPRSHWQPKVVPQRYYSVRLNYQMNNPEVLRKAVLAAAASRRSHRDRELVAG